MFWLALCQQLCLHLSKYALLLCVIQMALGTVWLGLLQAEFISWQHEFRWSELAMNPSVASEMQACSAGRAG